MSLEQYWQFDLVASVSFAKHSEQPQTWQRYAGVTHGWMDECVVHAFASLPGQWRKARMTELSHSTWILSNQPRTTTTISHML